MGKQGCNSLATEFVKVERTQSQTSAGKCSHRSGASMNIKQERAAENIAYADLQSYICIIYSHRLQPHSLTIVSCIQQQEDSKRLIIYAALLFAYR